VHVSLPLVDNIRLRFFFFLQIVIANLILSRNANICESMWLRFAESLSVHTGRAFEFLIGGLDGCDLLIVLFSFSAGIIFFLFAFQINNYVRLC